MSTGTWLFGVKDRFFPQVRPNASFRRPLKDGQGPSPPYRDRRVFLTHSYGTDVFSSENHSRCPPLTSQSALPVSTVRWNPPLFWSPHKPAARTRRGPARAQNQR